MTTETENADPFVNYDSHLQREYWNTIQYRPGRYTNFGDSTVFYKISWYYSILLAPFSCIQSSIAIISLKW